jgi:hypothetical protein
VGLRTHPSPPVLFLAALALGEQKSRGPFSRDPGIWRAVVASYPGYCSGIRTGFKTP